MLHAYIGPNHLQLGDVRCENIPIKGSLCVYDTSRPLIASDLDGHFLDPRKHPALT